MPLNYAGPAEIIRSSQKDEYFLSNLRGNVSTLLQKVKGVKWWIRWSKEADLVTNASYFALTTLLGNQTLGEEYVNILQVDKAGTKIPSLWRLTAMASMHVGGIYLLDYVAQVLQRHLKTHPSFLSNHPERRQFLLKHLDQISRLASILHRCHLVIFYFRAHYYHVSKQLTGIRYLLIRNWLENTASRWIYCLLGSLSLLQLLLTTTLYVNFNWGTKVKFGPESRSASRESTPERSEQSKSCSKTCSLCLETLSSPTATPCGHIYCWECIINSLERKAQCPLCCAQVDPSRLIFLKNFI